MIKVNINAEISGKDVADQLLNEIKTNHGIVVNDGSYTIKCLVTKGDKEVEVEIERVRFVFTRN